MEPLMEQRKRVSGDPAEDTWDTEKELQIEEERQLLSSPRTWFSAVRVNWSSSVDVNVVSSVWRKVCPLLAVCLELFMCVFDKAHLSGWCGIPGR